MNRAPFPPALPPSYNPLHKLRIYIQGPLSYVEAYPLFDDSVWSIKMWIPLKCDSKFPISMTTNIDSGDFIRLATSHKIPWFSIVVAWFPSFSSSFKEALDDINMIYPHQRRDFYTIKSICSNSYINPLTNSTQATENILVLFVLIFVLFFFSFLFFFFSHFIFIEVYFLTLNGGVHGKIPSGK